MKKLLLPVLAFFLLAGASSCAKCVTCKKGDQWQKLCDKDNTKEDVSDAISYLEAIGWDCRKSTQTY